MNHLSRIKLHSAVSELVYVRGWLGRGIQYDSVHLSPHTRDALATLRCIWGLLGLLQPGPTEGREYPAIVLVVDELLRAITQCDDLYPIERQLLETAVNHLRNLLYVIEQERTD